MRGQLGSSNRT